MSTKFLSFHPASEFLKSGQLALCFLPWPEFVMKVEGSYYLTVCMELMIALLRM